MRCSREKSSTGVGGVPARTDSSVTAASRRENAAYMVGRYAMSRATSSRPNVASLKPRAVVSGSAAGAKPSVSRAEPLARNAAAQPGAPRAQ